MLEDLSAQNAIVRFTLTSKPAGGISLLPSCWKWLKRRGMRGRASAGAFLNLVEVAGVEPASEDTAAQRLQA